MVVRGLFPSDIAMVDPKRAERIETVAVDADRAVARPKDTGQGALADIPLECGALHAQDAHRFVEADNLAQLRSIGWVAFHQLDGVFDRFRGDLAVGEERCPHGGFGLTVHLSFLSFF